MEEGSTCGANSKLELVSTSSSSSKELKKLLDRARHDVENMPGADLWRREEVEEAMTKDKESMSCDELKKSIDRLRKHVNLRVAFLTMVRTDPLSLSTGWDVSRFWRFRCAVCWFGIRGKYPLKIEEKFRTKGVVLPLWKYMTHRWRKEDRDVTLDEVSHNLHVYFQLKENKRINLLAAAALKKWRHKRPPSLRVEVLEKQARRHGGGGIVPKKKKKKLNSACDGDDNDIEVLKNQARPHSRGGIVPKKKKKKPNSACYGDGAVPIDDNPVSPHLSTLEPNRIPVRFSKLKPS